jgi:hypothetical protein
LIYKTNYQTILDFKNGDICITVSKGKTDDTVIIGFKNIQPKGFGKIHLTEEEKQRPQNVVMLFRNLKSLDSFIYSLEFTKNLYIKMKNSK